MSRAALITGASRGLGRALAQRFWDGGYNLLLSARSRQIKQLGEVVYGDLNSVATLDELTAKAFFMGVSVLINNAGVYYADKLRNMEEPMIRDVVGLNLVAPILLTRRLWPALKRSQGVVVNINSVAGRAGGDGESVYAASKYGLRGFSTALQFDGTRDDVRVINVCLGAMNTEMTVGRPNSEKFINPAEVAEAIYSAVTEGRTTVRMTELELVRRLY